MAHYYSLSMNVPADDYLDIMDILAEEKAAYWYQSGRIYKLPKINIQRIPEDKIIVPIVLNFKITSKSYLRDRFLWNLYDSHISPKEFISELCR